MSYDLAVGLDWQDKTDRERVFGNARAADAAGVHSIWTSEAWGSDGFTPLVLLADRTKNVRLGTSIVNIYSRSPAALAQQFVSLDEISGGRAIIGLGASGANVIEHFHGVPFKRPLRRMREYVEIINMLVAGQPLTYQGQIFNLQRRFTLRSRPVRDHIPIYIASLTPKSVKQTAEIADGWLPTWTPVQDLPRTVKAFRDAASAAGRNAGELVIRSPGTVVVTSDVERARKEIAGRLAFYLARMGVFYYEHVSRLGYQRMADEVRRSWEAGGSAAGAAAVPPEMQQAMSLVTDSVEEARERLAQQAEAGVNLHGVEVRADSPEELRRTYATLAG